MVNINFYRLQMIKEKGGRYNLDNRRVTTPNEAFKLITEVYNIAEEAEEVLILVTLNTKNNITGVFEVCRGSINSSIVHPREVFKRALLNNASNIMLFHNHPSGDLSPSKEDINITTRLKEAGELLGVSLLDHLIIGYKGYLSLKEKGLM